MRNRYMIVGVVDDGNPNCVILFYGDTLKEVREVYKLLLRFQDLNFPETEELKKEYEQVKGQLEMDYGVCITNSEDMLAYIDWDITGIFDTKKLNNDEIKTKINR